VSLHATFFYTKMLHRLHPTKNYGLGALRSRSAALSARTLQKKLKVPL